MLCYAIVGCSILFGLVTLAIFLFPYKVTCSGAGIDFEKAGFGSLDEAELFYETKTAAGKTCTKEYR